MDIVQEPTEQPGGVRDLAVGYPVGTPLRIQNRTQEDRMQERG